MNRIINVSCSSEVPDFADVLRSPAGPPEGPERSEAETHETAGSHQPAGSGPHAQVRILAHQDPESFTPGSGSSAVAHNETGMSPGLWFRFVVDLVKVLLDFIETLEEKLNSVRCSPSTGDHLAQLVGHMMSWSLCK